ncbi:metallopeptidase TldD-related protein [Streptomyces sp. NPDC051985]|uniref:metallopeptidase TldD-related protein n=1 Tax=Streptomyces sp. NPDC051985 TaxID=3155807 RepID=UPI003448AA70
MTDIQELVEIALSSSTADACIVIGEEKTEANLRWANNTATTIRDVVDQAVTVIAVYSGRDGTRTGARTRTVSTPGDVEDVVRAAQAAARTATADGDAMPLVERYDTDDDWSAPPLHTGVDALEPLIGSLARHFRSWSAADRSLFGYAYHRITSTFLATSTGLRRRYDQPSGTVELTAKPSDFSRSAFVSTYAPAFSAIEPDRMIEELARRLDWGHKRIELPPGRYETILPPGALADFMVTAYNAMPARDAEEGRSVYAGRSGLPTRIGEALTAQPIRLFSDPDHPGLECRPFVVADASDGKTTSVFDNGLPVAATDWIRDGELTELVRTRAWARRSNAVARPRLEQLVMTGPDEVQNISVDDLVAGTDRGLLLTSLWYIRDVDPQSLLLTGLTRDGTYLIENGRIVGEVNNFRFNESPIDLLARSTQIGRTEVAVSRCHGWLLPRTAMPALRVPDFNMSTVSHAS